MMCGDADLSGMETDVPMPGSSSAPQRFGVRVACHRFG
jgi:hypothetical protein